MRYLFLIAAPLMFVLGLSAQVPERVAVEQSIVSLDLQAAKSQCKSLNAMDRLYYQSRISFLEFILVEDNHLLEVFLDESKFAIQGLDKMSSDNPQKNVMCAELFFLRGVGKMLNQKLVGAALDIKSACTLLDKNQRKFPKNIEQKKLLGVFHVAMSAIPKKLRWLSNALCFRGDLNTGISYLESASVSSSLLRDEAQVILFYFEKNVLSQPEKALQRIENLHEKNPKSMVFSYFKLSGMLELREIDKALDFCRTMEAQPGAGKNAEKLPLWYYTRAKAHYFRLDYAMAIVYFDRFLNRYKGKTLYSDAMFRKGMALILMDRYPEARKVFHEMSNVKSSTFDEDEYASHMASIYRFRAPDARDKGLFRARNLFDGGYYQRSTDILDGLNLHFNELNQNQKTELFYRKGRNQQALNLNAQAKDSYLKCIQIQPGQALWMKVYAHFYLGQLSEAESDIESARKWYKLAQGFDEYEYQSGLEQRTKASLHRLKNRNNPHEQ